MHVYDSKMYLGSNSDIRSTAQENRFRLTKQVLSVNKDSYDRGACRSGLKLNK